MRAVVQRVRSASVDVGEERIAAIGAGLVVLLGVGAGDAPEDGERLEKGVFRAKDMSRDELARLVKDLEQQMKEAADALDYELAAVIRDRLFEVKDMMVRTKEPKAKGSRPKRKTI